MMTSNRLLLTLVLGLLACVGEIAALDPPGEAPAGAPPERMVPVAPRGPSSSVGGSPLPARCQGDPSVRLPALLRSLTGHQYANVLRAAFPTARAAIDAMKNPFGVSEISTRYTTDASTSKLNQAGLEALLDAGARIGAAARPGILAAHACLGALPSGSARGPCLRGVVDSMLDRLFNGEITEAVRVEKVAYLSKLIDALGVDLAIETFAATVMMSPRTLWRSELGVVAGSRRELTARELAEALSFSVAGARPDQALLAAASDGKLTAEEIRQHVVRLTEAADEPGPARFVGELLTIANLAEVTRTEGKNTDALPDGVRAALELETRETIERIVRAGGSTVDQILTASTALARRETLALRGVTSGSTPDAAGFFQLSRSSRPGLLLQPALMALLAADNHADPVKRGNFVMQQLMCVSTPAPPPDVPMLPAADPARPMTTRDRLMMVHRSPACATCHDRLDNIGLAFEGFDHLGRERATELGRPVDTSGEVMVGIPSLDGKVSGAQALVERMSGKPEVRGCVATHAFRYLSGVFADTSYQGCLWQAVASLVAGSEGNLTAVFAALLSSDLYRVRVSDPS
jgi:hypothetical protein